MMDEFKNDDMVVDEERAQEQSEILFDADTVKDVEEAVNENGKPAEKIPAAEQSKVKSNGKALDESAADDADYDVEKIKKSEKQRLSAQDRRKAERAKIQKQMDDLKKRQAELMKQLSDNRGNCLNRFKADFYRTMMKQLNLDKKEKQCFTDSEFADLLQEAKDKFDGWKDGIEMLKYQCCVPAFEDMSALLGFGDQLQGCETRDDYRKLYAAMKRKIKELNA